MFTKLKIITAFLFLLLLTGCTHQLPDNEVVDNKVIEADPEIEIMLTKLDAEKMNSICSQNLIPSEYASTCYFQELEYCKSSSKKMVKKSELGKCLPIFLKEIIENSSY
jgi:hypothetical protein